MLPGPGVMGQRKSRFLSLNLNSFLTENKLFVYCLHNRFTSSIKEMERTLSVCEL